jgi:hypothetical protein
MLQERLNGLAVCNIEKDILNTVDLEMLLKILNQEMPKDAFLKSTKAMYFYLW